MRKILVFLLLVVVFTSCKAVKTNSQKKVKLKFLDEYIVPKNSTLKGDLIGGLSGIDYANGRYYLICDDASNPRYYEASITINNSKIDSISFNKVVQFNDSSQYFDVEAIRFDKNTNNILITSEGSIKNRKSPTFFSLNEEGAINHYFEIPKYFEALSSQRPRNNGTLEGLAISSDNEGYWIAMELPLESDGPEPKTTSTKSPVRITYIDAKSKRPTRQFSYLLDKIVKIPKGNFAVNGLTDLIEYKKNQFLILERSYSSGWGTQGNTVKLFNINAANASNTIHLDNLVASDYNAAKKELIFDFESIRSLLTDASIDNIEGITLGPTLPNGNQSLVLVADNNFNMLGPQLNQFILLEIVSR